MTTDAAELGRSGFWESLRDSVDFARYRPRVVTDVEAQKFTSTRGEVYFIVKNRANHKYLRLAERDYALMQLMNGERSVRDLVMEYFRLYKAFAWSRVANLVEELRAAEFLADRRGRVITYIRRQFARRSLAWRAAQVVHFFMEKHFVIARLDGVLGRAYDLAIRFLYTRPAKIASVLVVLFGLWCFGSVLHAQTWSLVKTHGSYLLGILLFILFNIAIVAVHEAAHAFTTKAYGRELPRGGFLIYLGMPAFFVDTTDMWLEKKSRRLAVSWAGPYSELIIGGAICVYLYFGGAAGSTFDEVMFRVAFLCYMAVFVNLNPLLELDGYYMLMDWLEIPQLRRRSFKFVRGALWQKLFKREKLGREEKILTLYGTLALLYTTFSVFVVVYFWHSRVYGAVVDIWQNRGWRGRIVLLAATAAIVLPVVYIVLSKVYFLIKGIIRWVEKREFLANPRNTALVFGGAAVVLAAAVAAIDAEAGLPFRLAPFLILFVAAVALIRIVMIAPQFGSLPLLTAAAGWLLVSPMDGRYDVPPWQDMTSMGAALALIVAAFLFARLWFLSWAEKLALAVATAAATAGGVYLVGQHENAAALAALLFVAALAWTPMLLNYFPTMFRWPALVAGAGLAVLLVGNVAGFRTEVPPRLIGAVELAGLCLLGASALAIVHTVKFFHFPRPESETKPVFNTDAERLDAAFATLVEILIRAFREMNGRRVALALVNAFNRRSTVVRIENDVPRAEFPASLALSERAKVYRSALDALLERMTKYSSKKLVDEAFDRAVRLLYWEEREVLTSHVLASDERLRDVNKRLAAEARSAEAVVRANPVFAGLADAEIGEIASRLRPLSFKWGDPIIRQGDVGDRFYIIASGEVEVRVRKPDGGDETVARLGPNDFFGEIALLRDVPRTASCIPTSRDVDVLYLDKGDFRELVARHFEMLGKVEKSAGRVAMVRNMPLFAEFTPAQIGGVLRALTTREARAGDRVITQGEVGREFYIIESGRLSVSVRAGEAEKVVAELGRGEYVGEIALLEDVPRTATVTAKEDSVLLVLARQDFDKLVREQMHAAADVAKVASRRRLDLQRKTAESRLALGGEAQ